MDMYQKREMSKNKKMKETANKHCQYNAGAEKDHSKE